MQVSEQAASQQGAAWGARGAKYAGWEEQWGQEGEREVPQVQRGQCPSRLGQSRSCPERRKGHHPWGAVAAEGVLAEGRDLPQSATKYFVLLLLESSDVSKFSNLGKR